MHFVVAMVTFSSRARCDFVVAMVTFCSIGEEDVGRDLGLLYLSILHLSFKYQGCP